MNGHLGPSFPLNSGVAQGCPISPLLFLVITEALTRLIVNDPHIEGIVINGVRHLISQYADDSTLIGRHFQDWLKQKGHLDTWCAATAMSENASKREGQLLGKLNRQKAQRAPTGIIKDDAWVKDGDSIRALGVPMGNHMDELKWWRKKYREVKARIAAWRSIAHMSITGRNLLLQAILYGSLRFWFFSLRVPKKIIEMVESDAYHLIWASHPELFSDEEGTEKKSRAYIHKAASYIDQKKGGGGLLHLRSHINAFYAQWGRRYLHPSHPPWKSIADVWLANKYPLGRGSMMAAITGNFHEDVPIQAKYFRECIKQFESISLKQNTTDPPTWQVAGESLDLNHRFTIPLPGDTMAKWSKFLGLCRINNLIDQDTDAPFTKEDMKKFTYIHAPKSIKNTPTVHEWSDDLMKSWDTLIGAVPDDIIHAANQTCHPTTPGSYVAFTPDNSPPFYALTEIDPQSSNLRYHRQWIDTFGTPHNTGTYVSNWDQMRYTKYYAALWIEENEEDAHYNFQDKTNQRHDFDDDPEKEIKIHIIGPASLAFPCNEGWSPTQQHPDPQYQITKLAHLTIKRITKLFTHFDIIKDARPNCVENWQARVGNINIDKIWPTLGTPLSDATQEKNWRKALHRAIFTRNRDSKRRLTGDIKCRAVDSTAVVRRASSTC